VTTNERFALKESDASPRSGKRKIECSWQNICALAKKIAIMTQSLHAGREWGALRRNVDVETGECDRGVDDECE
jgi:hypothetical protein